MSTVARPKGGRPAPRRGSEGPAGRQSALAEGRKQPAVGFVSLGCPKALVDSERILSQLRAEGYTISPTYREADLVVVNTCGFIDAAVEESLDAIGEALSENGRVIVTGCLGARRQADGGRLVQQVHPSVLAVTGPHATDEVLQHVHTHLPRPHEPFADLIPPAGVKLTPRHYAYLKIAEGCNQSCTFCVIPSMRGKLVSRPIGEVVTEAGRLVQQGVRELLIVSQDTGAYGVDLQHRTDFVQGRPVRTHVKNLVTELARFGAWVRLHYVYPYPHIDELIPLMAEGRLLPYLDVPFQHAHPRILRLMRRPANAERNIDRIRAWRAGCPELTIRSTFITGFPGETEEEFEALLEFIRQAQLDRVGCFAYSPVQGAAANELPDPVPEPLREERKARLMQVQAEVSRSRLAARIGRIEQVVIDQLTPEGGIGRTRFEAPEIDGVVRVTAVRPMQPGSVCHARIVSADEHDLAAVQVQLDGAG
ncbi:MAG TPA: 30S ribosomal protein S12 methylthiotransferase RimO [Burkholderiaceae bacterium]|nr:30S ribosomal protein S12 methylthiotransferase RimO [Burkholderiaceae bacterium]